jgi:5'(3')-deoxyribonucleotidase
MKTIQFDVDGVLADFVLGFTQVSNKFFGSPLQKTAEIASWSDWGLETKQVNEVWKYISTEPNFWRDLPPLVSPTVFEYINELSAVHHVVFVTHRVCGFPSPQFQTQQFLIKNGVHAPNVVLARNKGAVAQAINANFSIEDKLENAEQIHVESKAVSYLVNRPYNQTMTGELFDRGYGVIRVNTVSEFLAEVQ